MIDSIQLSAAIASQIEPLNLKVGESDTAVVLNTLGQLQTITFIRTEQTFIRQK